MPEKLIQKIAQSKHWLQIGLLAVLWGVALDCSAYVVRCAQHELTPENCSKQALVKLKNNAQFPGLDPANYFLYAAYRISVPAGMSALVTVVIDDKAQALCTGGVAVGINRLDYFDYSSFVRHEPMSFSLSKDTTVFLCPYAGCIDDVPFTIGYDNILGFRIEKIVNAPSLRYTATIMYTISVQYFGNRVTQTYDINYRQGLYGSGTERTDKKEARKSVVLRDALFTRSGYTQAGWSKNASGDTKDYDLCAPYETEASLTLYPYWRINPKESESISVKFDANGGAIYSESGMMVGSSVLTKQKRGVTWQDVPDVAKDNCEFQGWWTQPIGGTQVNVDNLFSGSPTTLYAQWKTVYAITYEPGPLGDGALVTDSKNASNFVLKDALFTRKYYLQTGWSTDLYGSVKSYDLNAPVNLDTSITLYPYWTALPLYISIDGDSQIDSNGMANYVCNIVFSDGHREGCVPTWSLSGDDCATISSAGVLVAGNIMGDKPKTIFVKATWKDFTARKYVTIAPVHVPGFTIENGVLTSYFGAKGAVVVPDGIVEIGQYAFKDCQYLTSVSLPQSLKIIGYEAFKDCIRLDSIDFPTGLTDIGVGAFEGCTSLRSVLIPGSVKKIDSRAFAGCSGLSALEVVIWNEMYASRDGVLYDKSVSRLIRCPAGKSGPLIIPSGVKNIGVSACENCEGIESVFIPTSVTNIENSAFGYCAGLVSLTIPGSVEGIGSYAFDGCSKLTTITLSQGVKKIGWSAFSHTGLKTVLLPDSVTYIGDFANASAAFSKCKTIQQINVSPKNEVFSSEDGVLYDKCKNTIICCPEGKTGSFTVPESVKIIGNSAFQACTQLTSIELPYGLVRIENCAFDSCTGLKAINVPANVIEIGSSAFSGCIGLARLDLPAALVSLGSDPVGGCVNLIAINVQEENQHYMSKDGLLYDKDMETLIRCPEGKSGVIPVPYGVKAIAQSAFSCCKSTSVTLPSSVSSIGKYAFSHCGCLTRMILPPSVADVEYMAFSSCSNLADVTFLSEHANIGRYAFAFCRSLGSIKLPPTLKSIEGGTFEHCEAFKTFAIPEGVTSVGDFAFAYCANIEDIFISSGVTNIGYAAFSGCESLRSIDVSADNVVYASRDGVLYDKSMCTLIAYPLGKGDNPTIPAGVKKIYARAFWGNETLTSVTIPSGVESVGIYAFEGCGRLTSVYIPSSVTYLQDAFVDTPLSEVLVTAGDTERVKSLLRNSGADLSSIVVREIYDIRYYAGGKGSGVMRSAMKMRGASLTLMSSLFKRAGYTQTGWTTQDGGSKVYDLGGTYSADASVTLYPSWTANTYTIRFMANGGSGTMADQKLIYDVAQMLSANRFKYEGKYFVGWATRERGAVVFKNRAEVKNLTAEQGVLVYLYAVWEDGAAGLYSNDPSGAIGSDESAPYASVATTYDGYLYGEDDIVVGSVQVKVAKGKKDKKSGMFSAKVTATVQLADGTKKISFKGGVADAAGMVTGLAAKDHALEVSLGVNGLGGTFDGKYQIDGARNVFGAKDAEAKSVAAAVDSDWAGKVINIVGGGEVLTVAIAKKGKVKVSGTVNGVKVSATSQLLVGETCCCIPVVITKKANLAFTLWLESGGIDVVGLDDGAVADTARPLKADAKFHVDDDGVALLAALGGKGEPYGEYLPEGLSVAQSGKKWVVADGAKAGKVTVGKTGVIDESKLGANPSGLKLTYTEKSGSFKGSFKVYNLENGKVKSYTVNVTGVMIGDVGYGTATLKKPACSFPISIK